VTLSGAVAPVYVYLNRGHLGGSAYNPPSPPPKATVAQGGDHALRSRSSQHTSLRTGGSLPDRIVRHAVLGQRLHDGGYFERMPLKGPVPLKLPVQHERRQGFAEERSTTSHRFSRQSE